MSQTPQEAFNALIVSVNVGGDDRDELLAKVVDFCGTESMGALRDMFACTKSGCNEMYLRKQFGDVAADKLPS